MVGGSSAATPMEATPTVSAPLVGGHFTQQSILILGAFSASNSSKNSTHKSYAEAAGPQGTDANTDIEGPTLTHSTSPAALAQASGPTVGPEAGSTQQHTIRLSPS